MNLNSKLAVSLRALVVVCLGASLYTANAALISQESFVIGPGAYTVGDIDGQGSADAFYSSPWWKADASGNVYIVANGLSYPGVQCYGGAVQSYTTGRAGRNLASAWTDSTVGTYYVSFLASFGAATAGAGVHHRPVEAWDIPWAAQHNYPGDGHRILQVGYSEWTGLGGTNMAAAAGISPTSEANFDPALDIVTDNGGTHLFVLRFDLSNTSGGDVVSIYRDPTLPGSEPGSPDAVLFGIDFRLAAFGDVCQFVWTADNPISYFDELRFGDGWGDVTPVPEPTTLSLFGLAGLALLLAARRKRA